MEEVNLIVASLEKWLENLHHFLDLYPSIGAGALTLLVAMALVTKRVLVFVGLLLLSAIELLCMMGVTDFVALFLIASYVGGWIIALMAFQSRRKSKAIQAKLTTLRADVNQLLGAESRRLLTDLRSRNTDNE